MPSWREVAEVAAAQRAEWLAAHKERRPKGSEPPGLDEAIVEVYACPLDLDHGLPGGGGYLTGHGNDDRGKALLVAKRLAAIDAEREKLAADSSAHASDDRKRTARLRALDTEAEHLGPQLDGLTSSWWPEQPPTGRTAAGTAARAGVTSPRRREYPRRPVNP